MTLQKMKWEQLAQAARVRRKRLGSGGVRREKAPESESAREKATRAAEQRGQRGGHSGSQGEEEEARASRAGERGVTPSNPYLHQHSFSQHTL